MTDKNDSNQLPYMNSTLELEKRVEDLLQRLTLEEKFKLLRGKTLYAGNAVKRLGIKRFGFTDGPKGVAAHSSLFRRNTAFPTCICLSSSWDPELAHEFGVALARETRAARRHMILGPGINIQRSPLCGRTFEYLTEDPYLNKNMAVSIVKGVQSQRISACVKHYLLNNSETKRGTVSAEAGERALKEIYLPGYEATVREADAWSFMTSYNKINGVYGSENKKYLKDTLMDEWGFRGFVVTDWFATKRVETTEACINARLSVEMPRAIKYKSKNLKEAYEGKKFTDEALDDCVRRFLRVMFLVGMFDDKETLPPGSRNTPEHRELARKIAEQGMVLLKNDDALLPLDMSRIKKIAVLGPNAKRKHEFILKGGSSAVLPPHEITPLKGLKEKCKEKVKITSSAKEADVAIVFAGLRRWKNFDSEAWDRQQLELDDKQVELILNTIDENPKTIVVLVNGSPIGMDPWLEKIPAVLEAWYPGMEGGHAIANVLFGDVNPSGKLPMTFPRVLSDSPAHASESTFPGVFDEEGNFKIYYKEGIFVGYRYFDTKNVEPLFPFGHGLSYTTFKHENLKLSSKSFSEKGKLTVSVDVTNSGDLKGAEIVQLYVQDMECSVERPLKELKGFKKVLLEPGQKETVTLEISKSDLSFYSEKEGKWVAEKGKFKALVGSSSRDIRLEDEFEYLG
ncbi:MAG: glycoside hydrolase family 3 C-terminal domain-containing protein [Candidatus Hodarchaeota archaeon]